MTDEQKREHAEAIKHALGMEYGPPMEGEEGWVPPTFTVRGIDAGPGNDGVVSASPGSWKWGWKGRFDVEPEMSKKISEMIDDWPHDPYPGVPSEHRHTPDDGRGPRRVLVDGKELPNVVRCCHTEQGWAEVYMSREERPPYPGPSTKMVYGKVEVVPMTVEDADDESADAIAEHLEQTAKERVANAQAVIDAIREAQERRLADERVKAAEPKPAPPSDDPWAVIGKAEDDGEWIMKKVRDFG